MLTLLGQWVFFLLDAVWSVDCGQGFVHSLASWKTWQHGLKFAVLAFAFFYVKEQIQKWQKQKRPELE